METGENTLADGTVIRTRTTNTRQQQLTTERQVVSGSRLFDNGGVGGGDAGEDEVFGSLRRLLSPRASSSGNFISKLVFFLVTLKIYNFGSFG